jgi:hypothetical protein
MTSTKSHADLAAKLEHLDPGGCLPVKPEVLREMFGNEASITAMIREAEKFAEAHRCTFTYHADGQTRSEFIKDDIF